MKAFAVGYAVAMIAVLAACGGEAGTPAKQDEIARELATLPAESRERGAALERLAEDHPGDTRVAAAIREFEDANSPGLLARAEVEPGRELAFYEPDPGTLLVVERGLVGEPSILEERGLRDATHRQVWEALFAGEPVPDVIADAEEEPPADSVVTDELAAWPAHEARGVRERAGRDEGSAGVGQVRQAFSADPDAFILAGGCDTRPSPGATDYPNIVRVWCDPGWGNGYTWHETATHGRWRVASYSGGVFNVRLFVNGATHSVRAVTPGAWQNFNISRNGGCSTRCCGLFCLQTCTTCSSIPALLGIEVTEAIGDGFHMGLVLFHIRVENRADTQPWL